MNSTKQTTCTRKNRRVPPATNSPADSSSITVPVMNRPQSVENQWPKLSQPEEPVKPAIVRPNAPKP